MAKSRAERRSEREPAVVALFGADRASAVLDLLEIVELAWHDTYGDITPPDDMIADMLVLSDGALEGLASVWRTGGISESPLRSDADPGDQCALRDTSGLQSVSHHHLPS